MPRNLDYPMPLHGRMMRQRLWEAQLDAGMLYDTLRDDDRVPAWTIDKVARGAGDIHQVSRYLRFKASHPAQWGAPDASVIQLPFVPEIAFYRTVLTGIGAPISAKTLALLYAWRQTEGGDATYNPLNTTWKKPGSTTYNTHGVQNDRTPADGVDATVKTLLNPRYADIVAALRRDEQPSVVAEKIIASQWGTKGLLRDVIAMFARGKIVVRPIATAVGAPTIASLEAPVVVTEQPERPTVRRRRGLSRNWFIAGLVISVVLGIALPLLLRGPSAPKSNPRRRRARR